jgi:hypothetical protein
MRSNEGKEKLLHSNSFRKSFTGPKTDHYERVEKTIC